MLHLVTYCLSLCNFLCISLYKYLQVLLLTINEIQFQNTFSLLVFTLLKHNWLHTTLSDKKKLTSTMKMEDLDKKAMTAIHAWAIGISLKTHVENFTLVMMD